MCLPLPGRHEAEFEVWKGTAGGRHLLRAIYRDAAQFAARFERTGQRVSMDYLFHRQRDRIAAIKVRLAKSHCTLPKVGGYRLNDHFTAYIARHIVSRRKDWEGMFELWEVGKTKLVKRTTIVKTEVLAA